MSEPWLIELRCEACTWHALGGPAEMERRLRGAGHLRRAEKPTAEMVRELLAGVVQQLACPDCGQPGLRWTPFQEEDDWAAAPQCEICRKPIPPERLEALPGATRCLNCQQDAEAGRHRAELEFCPRCGALLELRVSRQAGITRYKLFCTGMPPCRM